jgi:hypothetical protein
MKDPGPGLIKGARMLDDQIRTARDPADMHFPRGKLFVVLFAAPLRRYTANGARFVYLWVNRERPIFRLYSHVVFHISLFSCAVLTD